jgi:CheW-like domain
VTHAFRSISGLASRRRVRPAVERATFVVVAIGASRLAFPVEWVERVLRHTSTDFGPSIAYGSRALKVRDVATTLGLTIAADAGSTRRVLVLRDASPGADWCAAMVDTVHEVVAVEIALIRPVTDDDGADRPRHTAIRGVFERDAHEVWVLDPSRLLKEVA